MSGFRIEVGFLDEVGSSFEFRDLGQDSERGSCFATGVGVRFWVRGRDPGF